ncbi:MAG: sodium:solute symporter family protein [Saprospiraceae bacterium]|jgi:high affinity choline transporter 7|nr:sodium:solute symporter family protein [Saprospiraceae bacterium]MDB4769033.1 sodium:solute symporter family protein [Saprospiraceae bacterium]MDG1432766.1 sodium:solute symporter family protein [Saprospiraceae bacterium]MDG2419172.1 sodium:solute symporter family protein [Saprospiraceae bacterium]
MYLQKYSKLLPTVFLLIFLVACGLYLFVTGASVMWSGFIAMMFFYALIFYFGSYVAGNQKVKDGNDTMLAGRSIPLFIGIFTMSATWVGGGYINGTAESAKTGLVWVQAPWGYAISLIIGGLFFARIMRRHQFKTMLDPLSQRFGKRMAALLFIPALSGEIFWTAAILTALGTTFGTVLGLEAQPAIILSAIIAIAYTSIGGLWAVALTDVVQLVLLLGGLALVVPIAMSSVGGWDVAWTAYVEKNGVTATFFPSHENLGGYYWMWWDYALLLMFGGIPWQVYFQRVLSSKDEKTAVRLSVFAGVICIIAAIPAVLIGIIGGVADWEMIGAIPGNDSSILPHVIRYMTTPWVATIGLGAVAAAVMSSVDSSILSASSMAGWNVFRPLFKPDISPSNLEKVIKRSIWIIGIAATLLAINVQSVYDLWVLCSDFVYCLLFPALVCALFDKKANTIGAISGFAVSFILRFGGGEPTLNIPNMIPYPMMEGETVLFPFRTLAMLSGLMTIILVSRLTQNISVPRVLTKMEN